MTRPLPGVTQLIRLSTADSTQNVARFLAERGAPAGTLVWAERQTAGRGRLKRDWASPAGNLYVSWILRPKIKPAGLPKLSLAAAKACARALARLTGARTEVKAPNDVYVKDGGSAQKVCGILCEASGGEGALDWLVLGIGINVNAKPLGLPQATSLRAATGKAWELETVLAAVLDSLADLEPIPKL